jgi:hypothetical protein
VPRTRTIGGRLTQRPPRGSQARSIDVNVSLPSRLDFPSIRVEIEGVVATRGTGDFRGKYNGQGASSAGGGSYRTDCDGARDRRGASVGIAKHRDHNELTSMVFTPG